MMIRRDDPDVLPYATETLMGMLDQLQAFQAEMTATHGADGLNWPPGPSMRYGILMRTIDVAIQANLEFIARNGWNAPIPRPPADAAPGD